MALDEETTERTIRELGKYFDICAEEDSSELRLRPKLEAYSKEQVGIILFLLAGLGADEVDKEEDGWTRLWWD